MFGGPSLNGWWVSYFADNLKTGLILTEVKFDLINPPLENNRNLDQGDLHIWSNFGDPSLNGSRFIVRTNKWLVHRLTHARTHTHTDAGNGNTPRAKMASGKNYSASLAFNEINWIAKFPRFLVNKNMLLHEQQAGYACDSVKPFSVLLRNKP